MFKKGDIVVVTTTKWDYGSFKQSGRIGIILDTNSKEHQSEWPIKVQLYGKDYSKEFLLRWYASNEIKLSNFSKIRERLYIK